MVLKNKNNKTYIRKCEYNILMNNLKNLLNNNNMDKFCNPFTKRFVKNGSKVYLKLINSHDYNIYVRKRQLKIGKKLLKK